MSRLVNVLNNNDVVEREEGRQYNIKNISLRLDGMLRDIDETIKTYQPVREHVRGGSTDRLKTTASERRS